MFEILVERMKQVMLLLAKKLKIASYILSQIETSKRLQTEVVEQVDNDMAVEQNDSLSWDLCSMLIHELRDFLKRTTNDQTTNLNTYLFPLLIRSGFISPFLMCAKNNSAGAVAYEYGALSMTFILSCSIQMRVSLLRWYEAPSMSTTIEFLQSFPNCFVNTQANLDRYSCMTSSSVLTCVKESQTQP